MAASTCSMFAPLQQARARRRRTLSACLLVGLASASLGYASVPASFPVEPSDMIVVSHQERRIVFLADPRSGRIYWHPLSSEEAGEIPFFVFEEFLQSTDFTFPTALAFWQGKLIFVDRRASVLVEVDLSARRTRVLLGPSYLRDPVSLAVSEEGVIAIGQDEPDTVLLVDPASIQLCTLEAQPGGSAPKNCVSRPPRELPIRVDDPDRLSFAGPDLLILDTDSKTMRAVPQQQRSQNAAAAAEAAVAKIHQNFAQIDEFVLYRGVYYIARSGTVVALSPASGNASSPLVYPAIERPRMAATESSLLLLGRRSVLLRPRQVPVSVNLDFVGAVEPAQTDASQYLAIASLYAYLYDRSLLAVRDFAAERDYSTLRELLLEQDVLVRRPAAPGLPAGNAEADAKMVAVLCRLNESGCHPDMDRRVLTGESLRLPWVPMERSLTIGKVILADRSIDDQIRERVLPEQLAQIDNDYLYRINRQFLRSWEAFSARSNFVSVEKPYADLRPGTVVRVNEGMLEPVLEVQGCGADPGEIASRVVQGRPLLPIKTERDILPRRTNDPAAAEAARFGAQLSFLTLIEESLDPETLQGMGESLKKNGGCWGTLMSSDVYLVVAAQKAHKARYNILDRKGSVRQLSPAELDEMNLLGRADPDKRWSLIVDKPVYVAVRLARFGDDGEVGQAASGEVNDAQDFLESDSSVLNLPATKWRLHAFVRYSDLAAPGSEIDMISNLLGVSVLSEESVLVSRNSAETSEWAPDLSTLTDDEARNLIRQNRQRLIDMIHYHPPFPGISEITIGIGEARGSVHCHHPDFLSDSGSAWREPSSLNPIPYTGSSPALGTPLVKEFSEKDDHGDHVAGILVGRGDLAPGLIPGAGLFLIDTTSPAGLEKYIEQAIQLGVDIFSFSYTIPRSDPTLDALKESMSKWANQIFVAAAGNEGKDLKFTSERVPVTWGDDLNNIIGVSAADWNYSVLGSSSQDENGTNFGKKYIQLAAPGHEIYSTASDNKYALASGSSQAVPIVTAAVAMLVAQNSFQAPASLIKARLIYTADWYSPNFDDKVWGGLLNYKRAVWRPDLDLIVYKDNQEKIYEVLLAGKSKISVSAGEIDDPGGADLERPQEIPFRNILRIQWIPTAQAHRVIYLEGASNTTMRILNKANISGEIPCKEIRPWSSQPEGFGKGEKCVKDVGQIRDYVSSLPKVNTISF